MTGLNESQAQYPRAWVKTCRDQVLGLARGLEAVRYPASSSWEFARLKVRYLPAIPILLRRLRDTYSVGYQLPEIGELTEDVVRLSIASADPEDDFERIDVRPMTEQKARVFATSAVGV